MVGKFLQEWHVLPIFDPHMWGDAVVFNQLLALRSVPLLLP
jgi:hypothetical protein